MKKITLLLFIMFFLLGTTLFAQTVVQSTTFDIFGYLISLIPLKYQPLVFVIVSTLLLWEQFLARTNIIKANSTEQMITGWFKSIYAALKPKE
jgi:hypothetical protein